MLWIILSFLAGGMFGVGAMACLMASRDDDYHDEDD